MNSVRTDPGPPAGCCLRSGWWAACAAGRLLLFLLPVAGWLANPLGTLGDLDTLSDFPKNLAIMGGLLMVVPVARQRDSNLPPQ